MRVLHWQQRMGYEQEHINLSQWLSNCEISSKTNGWNDAVKEVKLIMLLKGQVITVWMKTNKVIICDYKQTPKVSLYGIFIIGSISLLKLQPGEEI